MCLSSVVIGATGAAGEGAGSVSNLDATGAETTAWAANGTGRDEAIIDGFDDKFPPGAGVNAAAQSRSMVREGGGVSFPNPVCHGKPNRETTRICTPSDKHNAQPHECFHMVDLTLMMIPIHSRPQLPIDPSAALSVLSLYPLMPLLHERVTPMAILRGAPTLHELPLQSK